MINSNNNSDNNPHTYFYMGMIAGSIIGFNGMILLTLLGLAFYNKENIIKNFITIYDKKFKNPLEKPILDNKVFKNFITSENKLNSL